MKTASTHVSWLLVGLGLGVLGGCGAGNDPTPPAELARTALDRSLSTWREGGPPGEITGSDPTIQAVDSNWRAGRKLGSYEIVKEEGGEGDRRFHVKLTLDDPAETKEAQYIVLGQGPVWVYHEEDYVRMINMDDNPVPENQQRRRR